MHSLSITNTCDGQTCKIKNYNAASCKWNGGFTTMQRATIKHMERYTNITVTKIMLVSVICLVLHKKCWNTFWFQQCCSFWWGSQVKEYSSNWLPDTSFPSIILHFEHMNMILMKTVVRDKAHVGHAFYTGNLHGAVRCLTKRIPYRESKRFSCINRFSFFFLFLLTTDRTNPCSK